MRKGGSGSFERTACVPFFAFKPIPHCRKGISKGNHLSLTCLNSSQELNIALSTRCLAGPLGPVSVPPGPPSQLLALPYLACIRHRVITLALSSAAMPRPPHSPHFSEPLHPPSSSGNAGDFLDSLRSLLEASIPPAHSRFRLGIFSTGSAPPEQ